jgi:hypothetical protein
MGSMKWVGQCNWMWHWMVKCLEAAKKERRRKSKTNSSICCVLACLPWGRGKPEPCKRACCFWVLAAPLDVGCGGSTAGGSWGWGYLFSLPPHSLPSCFCSSAKFLGCSCHRNKLEHSSRFELDHWLCFSRHLYWHPPLVTSFILPVGAQCQPDTMLSDFSSWSFQGVSFSK